MDATISHRNGKSNPEIFPSEMSLPVNGFLQCDMAKTRKTEPLEIFLGQWLKLAGIGPSEAAQIAGCTQSYISNISGGARTNVNALYLLKLSVKLGITVNDFFRKPPSDAQIAVISELSPEAQDMLLRTRRQKRA